MSSQSRDDKFKGFHVLDESEEEERQKSRAEAAAQNQALEAEIKALRERMAGPAMAELKRQPTGTEDPPSSAEAPSKTPGGGTALIAPSPTRNIDDTPRRPAILEKAAPPNDDVKTENEQLRREINGLNAKASAAQTSGTERIKTLRQRLAEVEKKRERLAAAMADLEQELVDFGSLLKNEEVADGPSKSAETNSIPTVESESRSRQAPAEPNPSNANPALPRWKSNKPL